MELTTLSTAAIAQLRALLQSYPVVVRVANSIHRAGGTALLVGGAVRDLLMALPIKDLDIEVHGLSTDDLERILKAEGPVSLVGKAYGVFRIHGIDVDWSLPRKDEAGRKPQVKIDPYMEYKEAFRRRDLTMNAMGIDLDSFVLIDPFGGYKDIQDGILRATDIHLFIEDPLRFYRVMQFVGRFAMKPDAQLDARCASMDVSQVSVERIEEEIAKLFLKSKQPSRAFRWLDSIGRLKDLFPELYVLKSVEQDAKWHPEGDVFEHTMQAIDAAAQFSYNSDEEKLIIMLAVLCHDIGKAVATQIEDGRITCHGHAEAGETIARKFLRRITKHHFVIDAVCKLVKYHMHPRQFLASGAKLPAYKRLALHLTPEVSIAMLAVVMRADRLGRNPHRGSPLSGPVPDVEEFLHNAQKAAVVVKPEEPVLHGKDLLDHVSPGPELGRLLRKAYEIQL